MRRCSFTYRFATDEERAWMDRAPRRVRDRRFPLHGGRGPEAATERALTQVQGGGRAYPLKWRVELDPPMPLAEALAGADGLPGR
jgi:putative ABC transport system permease protein